VELLGRYSKFSPLPQFTLEPCTARRTGRPGGSGADVTKRRHALTVRLSMKQRQDLIKAYATGTPSSEILKQFGVSKGALWKLLGDAGILRKVNSPTDEHLAEAERLYVEERWSLGRIGQHLGFANTTIYRHLKLRGVPIRQHPGGRSAPA